MYYWPYGQGGGWLGGTLMLISMVLLWAGLISVMVVLFRRFGRPVRAHDEAIRILDERFARGEIDQDEYQRRRTAIEQ